MTIRELLEKYNIVIFAKNIDPNAEATPEFEKLLEDFIEESREFYRLEKELMKNAKNDD